mmetsp:Transcript_13440/g.26603  ORF Transcript_13440/g.26603 Transcript_13440/m.26603 type:complete len:250 (-) Transcript_13440:375-1124(-)
MGQNGTEKTSRYRARKEHKQNVQDRTSDAKVTGLSNDERTRKEGAGEGAGEGEEETKPHIHSFKPNLPSILHCQPPSFPLLVPHPPVSLCSSFAFLRRRQKTPNATKTHNAFGPLFLFASSVLFFSICLYLSRSSAAIRVAIRPFLPSVYPKVMQSSPSATTNTQTNKQSHASRASLARSIWVGWFGHQCCITQLFSAGAQKEGDAMRRDPFIVGLKEEARKGRRRDTNPPSFLPVIFIPSKSFSPFAF